MISDKREHGEPRGTVEGDRDVTHSTSMRSTPATPQQQETQVEPRLSYSLPIANAGEAMSAPGAFRLGGRGYNLDDDKEEEAGSYYEDLSSLLLDAPVSSELFISAQLVEEEEPAKAEIVDSAAIRRRRMRALILVAFVTVILATVVATSVSLTQRNDQSSRALVAPAPPNDVCDSASVIDDANGDPISGSTVGASVNETIPACGSASNVASPNVWYRVMGTGATFEATTCTGNPDLDGDFDSQITVLSGSCGSLTCVAGNDNKEDEDACGSKAAVSWVSSRGTVYYIVVHGHGSETGDFQLSILSHNDDCESAVGPLQVGDVIAGSTVDATVDAVPDCDGAPASPGVWYYLEGSGALFTATACSLDGSFDRQIAVFSGSCSKLDCVTSNNEIDGLCASVGWATSTGTMYYILVHGSGGTGSFQLEIQALNDRCEDAVLLEVGDIEEGSTVFATDDNVTKCGRASASNSPGIWYKMYGTGDMTTATTCTSVSDMILTAFDSQITVLSGSCDNLACVAGNDDAITDVYNRESRCAGVSWSTTSGELYYVFVHGWFSTGSFNLAIQTYNDVCETAAGPLQVGEIVLGSTHFATADGIPACGEASESLYPGIWYSVVGNGDMLYATTCTNIPEVDGNYNSQITVLSGSCGNLSCVGGNDDTDSNPCGTEAGVSWASTAGESYYILVHGANSVTGTFGFVVTSFINDRCAKAVGPLQLGETVYGATDSATKSVVAACYNASQSDAPGLWFTVIGDGGVLMASICRESFWAQVTVLTGTCDDYECVAGEEFPNMFCGTIRWASSASRLYYVFVHGIREQTGSFELTVNPSINDLCELAIGPLTVGDIKEGSTVSAGSSSVDACGEASANSNATGVWFTVEGVGSMLTATTCTGTHLDGGFNSQISVFSGSCSSLACIAGNDDDDSVPCDTASKVSWNSMSGELYYIFVYGVGSQDTGSFGLAISESR